MLPDIIKRLEELVLASSGVEPFEEILKLIYAKLYAEKTGKLSFTTKNIPPLFNLAKEEWPGMFDEKDAIELSPAHLSICVKELGKIDLYQTDLSIIDTAFEYLLPKSAKGSRGQYFTPLHIIAEMVKILDPKKDEYILDPACGSGGFLLHAAKFVKNKKTLPKIYGVDFDKRMVKIAKALFLIAGFSNANIYKANSLAPMKEIINNSFDMILTNPPFGGEVRDEAILQQYELRKNNQRHILFVERIIRLLRPGGRAALVVPQGILNNTNLAHVREWLYAKARIIGVIGLDANTFKPHTNIKTSLLFLQKWHGQALVDYPVFMAVSQKSGKNRSGKLVDHDLGEITKNFREFIKKEKLGF